MSKTKSKDFTLDEAGQRLALEQLKSGKSLFSEGGAFGPMLQQLLEAALEGELAGHLQEQQSLDDPPSNRRNGHTQKQLKTNFGTLELSTPRDRGGTFEPELVKKRQTILADSLEERILGMYGLGMSLRDISSHIEQMYGTSISHTVLSEITDRVIPKVRQWQNRDLEAIYPIVWLDAMYYKVRSEEDGRVVARCLYNIIGINTDGYKEVLGCYISESEGARFWLSVLTDLQRRGVKDILIACIDNLKGFEEAILTVFPMTAVQSCIIHQVRNSCKYIANKDVKEAVKDMGSIYKAATKEEGERHLEAFELKWGKKYPLAVKSWRSNWDKLSTFFEYPDGIRKIIYTTNAIEGYHRQLRKVTKTKGAFPSDMALLKLIYLASMRISAKWSVQVKNWPVTLGQLSIIFGERMPLKL